MLPIEARRHAYIPLSSTWIMKRASRRSGQVRELHVATNEGTEDEEADTANANDNVNYPARYLVLSD